MHALSRFGNAEAAPSAGVCLSYVTNLKIMNCYHRHDADRCLGTIASHILILFMCHRLAMSLFFSRKHSPLMFYVSKYRFGKNLGKLGCYSPVQKSFSALAFN